jgi:hypothetical protein
MWSALGSCFTDTRLQQLFGRYATYAGSSPFEAPGTLNVIAHVERLGVWSVDGGMRRVAEAVAGLARAAGATIRCGAHVRELSLGSGRVRGVVLEVADDRGGCSRFAGDASAFAERLLARRARRPRRRSDPVVSRWPQSAAGVRAVSPQRLSRDYAREFEELGRGRVPEDPTIYLCAQDRERDGPAVGDERMFFIVNAPATNEGADSWNAARAQALIESTLAKHGARLTLTAPPVVATPADFARRFPGSNGAIYGAATHGMAATFARPGARSSMPGLYLAGGSVHPGAGVPMAAISGRLSATALSRPASIGRSRTAMHGGTSILSDDGRHGLVTRCSATCSRPALRRGSGRARAIDFVAVNVAPTVPALDVAMTERARAEARALDGRSSFAWQRDSSTSGSTRPVRLASPAQSRLVHPEVMGGRPRVLGSNGRHRCPIALPRVEVALSEPALAFRGAGYLDSNVGAEPLEEAFRSWSWSRFATKRGASVFYDVEQRDGTRHELDAAFDRSGSATSHARSVARDLGASGWGCAVRCARPATSRSSASSRTRHSTRARRCECPGARTARASTGPSTSTGSSPFGSAR